MEQYRTDVGDRRKPAYETHPLFVARWSARSMTGESLPPEAYMPLFEAARWAPSSRNRQPWRFVYAERDSEDWGRFLELLSEGNRRWARNAALLVVVVASKTTEDGSPLRTSSLSTGAAWQNLALEGIRRGLVVHPIAGFDRERARAELDVPDDFRVEIMTVIGVRGPKEALPDDLRARERPSDRGPLEAIVGEGSFEAIGSSDATRRDESA